jgi:chromosome segregation ATPase
MTIMVKDFIKIVTAILMSCLLLTADSYAAMPSGALEAEFKRILQTLANSGSKEAIKRARQIITNMKKFNPATAAESEKMLNYALGVTPQGVSAQAGADVDEMLRMIDGLSAQNDELQDRIRDLEAQLAKAQRGQREGGRAATEEIARLRSELTQREGELRRLQGERAGFADELRGAEAARNKAIRDQAGLQTELAAMGRAKTGGEAVNKQLQAELAREKAAAATQLAEMEKQHQVQLAAAQEQAKAQEERAQAAERDQVALRAELEGLKAKNARLERESGQAQQAAVRAAEESVRKIAQLERAVSDAAAAQEQHEGVRQRQDERIVELEQRLREASEQIEALEAQLEEARAILQGAVDRFSKKR